MRFTTLNEWLTWQESLHPKKIDLGLDRIKRVFDTLQPTTHKPFTVTVTGTNGKGSCVAYLDHIFRAQGYRVGTYTSPHLIRYNERIQIDGIAASDEVICQAFERVDRLRGTTPLSYFEFGTLAALDIFGRADLDIQVLEVGLGGRLDAVNIVDPDIALITSIDIDHTEWLGKTRDEIAYEKAGIFRSQVPAVVGDADPTPSILRISAEKRVPLSYCGRDFKWVKDESHARWSWIGQGKILTDLPYPALEGEHQLQNASAVLQALHLIEARVPITPNAIAQGLQSVQLPGRYQTIPGAVPVLLDVAHNPHAAISLAAYIRQKHAHKRHVYAIFSVMRDKDIHGIVSAMKPVIDYWFFAPLNLSRCATPTQIKETFAECGIGALDCDSSDFASAFAKAKQIAQDDDLLLVFGSFYLVGALLAQESAAVT